MKTKLQSKSVKVFNYSAYLRDYYFKMLSGEIKVPSDAELELFLRKLAKTPVKSNKKAPQELEPTIDDAELKLIA